MGARLARRKRGVAFPKPSDIARAPEPVRVMRDGREVINKMLSDGRNEYRRRIAVMLERQEGICCLYGWCPDCHGALTLAESTFEHEDGRGMGGAVRDDRIELPDGTLINGAAHYECNSWKGSRYIAYNRRLNVIRREA
jgi:hypothetical protein